ncbi:hypothetical protein GETHLI_04990 [Geothrix limicola]|uniref:Haem-binding uptake Tiki superfamily ChaN domain-containing protein n=1 Tax=Geothrix limicola TaxID=2927978 RepID=A0ABQ5QBB9_9BACT|nr:hypothetical protein [Geothrix limicola]GLH71997.1 hypothetical protein GETHLI_04990 [Geothrix limicola]
MRRLAAIGFLFVSACFSFAQVAGIGPALPSPEVYLVGAIHNMHFDPHHHYALQDLQAQILALKPDLICGEITPEAFERPMEGYFPPEAAFLAAMAPRWKMRFVPVDWRMDSDLQQKAEAEEPEAISRRVAELDQAFVGGMSEFKGDSLYDYLHSPATLALIDEKFEKVIGDRTVADVAAGSWHERNRRIVDNGLRAAGTARRIVFVFGVSHLPQLVRQLKARGIEASIPPRRFTPGGPQKLPAEVLARWSKNLENLRAVRDGRLAVAEDDARKVRNSRRIQDLEQALQSTASARP